MNLPASLNEAETMTHIIGIILLVVAIGMVAVARPKAGQDCAPFLRVWLIGQVYTLVTLTIVIAGVGLVLSGWFS
jgi:hypothetical protein